MKVTPVGNKIYLEIRNVKKIGDLDVSGKKSIREYGEVISVGSDVKQVKAGDRLLVKAWAIDTITHEGEDYFFVSENSDGICAVISDV